MKNKIKRISSFLLAVLMVLSAVPTFAATPGIALSIDSKDDFFAGVTYEVTATASGIAKEQLIDSVQSAFSWSSDGFAVNSSNNYSYNQESDGTYTATESAKFTLPEQAGQSYTLTVSYANAFNAVKSITTRQPITSISVSSSNDVSTAFYDADSSVLYIDNETTADFAANVTPAVSDDAIFVSATAPKGVEISEIIDNKFSVTVTDDCTSDFELAVTPQSGYKFQKTISVVNSIKTTSFTLRNNGVDIANTTSFSGEIYPDVPAGVKIMQDESFVVTPYTKKGNDEYVFTLTNNLTGEEINEFYTVDEKFNCTLNIHNPGTYLLECKAVSKGSTTKNGLKKGESILPRDLKSLLVINVLEANPITALNFYEVKDSQLTNTKLDSVTLYTDTAQSTYDISQNLAIAPEGYTNSVKYVSDDTTIATVSDAGVITAKKSGQTKIFAISDKNDSVFAVCNVNVVVGIQTITNITAPYDTLPAGHSEQLTVTATPAVFDEAIGWTSAIPEALSIDSNGVATANENYDFNGNDSVIVPVTATSQFGKTYTKYITVVPAVRAEKVDIALTDADGEALTPDTNGVYTSFTSQQLTLSASATDTNKNPSNDKLIWYVSIDGGEAKQFANADTTVFKYTANTDGSYNVTVASAASVVFTCFAIRSGEGITANTVSGEITLNTVAKATKISIVKPSTGAAYTSATIPAGESTVIEVNVSPFGANASDPVSLTSSNESVATVEQTALSTAKINAIKAGTANIVVKSASGSASATFKVTVSNNLALAEITGLASSYTYTGSQIKPTVQVIYGGSPLSVAYYDIKYTNNTNAGEAVITITGKGDFANSQKTAVFTIKPKAFSSNFITATSAKSEYVLTTSVREANATFTVKDTQRNVTLKKNTDYTVSYINNTAAGKGTAVITGIGNYSGSIRKEFIVKDQASYFTVSSISNQVYNGKAKTPSPAVYYKGKKLTLNTDYTLSYSSNINVGTAKIVIKGTGTYYTGSKTVQFNIVPSAVSGFKSSAQTYNSVTLKWNQSSKATGYQIYDASTNKLIKTITKNSTLTYKKGSLSSVKNYKFKIRAYTTVNGKNYYGPFSSVISVYTKPKGTSISSISAKSKGFTVKWKKQASQTTGYQIQYSTSSKFSSAKTVTISKNSTTSKTISKLKSKKKYYVRIRTYKTVNGKKIYSAWSAAKTVTTKK
ncbi:MAG: fibronectin type III domain-containing protein [Eubacterium sp.]